MFDQGPNGKMLLVALGLGWLAVGDIAAQDTQHHATGHRDPAIEAYLRAAERMHQDMAIEFTGPTVDFARAMIPHHQGAIDMAREMLEHGQDPEIRALAEEIIAAQEQGITLPAQLTEKPRSRLELSTPTAVGRGRWARER
jgi:uncharacterized protein (DUF305 family)